MMSWMRPAGRLTVNVNVATGAQTQQDSPSFSDATFDQLCSQLPKPTPAYRDYGMYGIRTEVVRGMA